MNDKMKGERMSEYEGSYNENGGDFDDDDVFGGEPKAINFTDEWEKGQTYVLPVLDKPKLIQGWDQNRKPAVWDDGSPKMVAVTVVEFAGERRSLWAPKPSALYVALVDASKRAGHSVRGGEGNLVITYGGLGKREGTKNAPHLFTAVEYEYTR
jgi:hypothetical protein